jgi:GGDEF domain-containing protein
MEQQNGQQEKELSLLEREAIAREALNMASVKRKNEGQEPVNELVSELAADLPVPLQKMLNDDYESMRESTDNDEVLRKTVEISYRRLMAGYERKLSAEENIPNESFAMLNAMEKIDMLFAEGEPTMEDLKRVARVSFDLNGLKAVNDLNGGDHKKGDMYLSMSAKAISAPEVVAFAEENGLNFEPDKVTRDGGDEFGVILSSDKPLDDKVLARFVRTVQEAFWNNSDVAKILDFENPEVIARFAKTEVREINEDFGGDLEAFKKAKGIPPGYYYRGAISGGAATLYDGLTDSRLDLKSRVKTGDNYQRTIQKMMGAMFSSSDRAMDENKKIFKEGLPDANTEAVFRDLLNSGVSEEVARVQASVEAENLRFLAQVYSRTEKEKELTIQVNELKSSNSKLESENANLKQGFIDLQQMLESGASKEALLEALKSKGLI